MKTDEIAPVCGVHEIDHYVQENQNRELDEIILKVSNDEFENQKARKYGHAFSRFIMEDGEVASVNAIASLLRQPGGTYLESSAGACNIVGTVLSLAGVAGASQILDGVSKTLSATSNYFEKGMNARKSIFELASQRYRTQQTAHTQQAQGVDSSLDKTHNLVDRWSQSQQSLAEKVIS